MTTIFLLAFAFVAAFFEGLVLSIMWRWFVVPVFHAPELSITYAIGLALLVNMLTFRVRKSENAPETSEIVASGLVTPWVFLGCGWIVKLFI